MHFMFLRLSLRQLLSLFMSFETTCCGFSHLQIMVIPLQQAQTIPMASILEYRKVEPSEKT